jgi:hypothetical protein
MLDFFEVLLGSFFDWGRGESFWRPLLLGLAALVGVAALVFVLWRRFA